MTGTAVIVLAAGAFMLGRRSPNRRIYLFCAVWIALTMAPALNLNALWWLVDDRYLYAPSFGWSLALAMVAMEIAASGSRARTVLGPALAVILVAYATSTMQTERYWRDDVAFFSRCVEIGPNEPDYRLRLAAAQNKAGNSEEAARVLERGTQLDPGDVHLHLKLAQQYQMMGRQADFMREFQKVTELSAAKALRNDTTGGAYTSQPAGGTP
jgi:tetratricopeptide (TPR) repeat protein